MHLFLGIVVSFYVPEMQFDRGPVPVPGITEITMELPEGMQLPQEWVEGAGPGGDVTRVTSDVLFCPQCGEALIFRSRSPWWFQRTGRCPECGWWFRRELPEWIPSVERHVASFNVPVPAPLPP